MLPKKRAGGRRCRAAQKGEQERQGGEKDLNETRLQEYKQSTDGGGGGGGGV